MPKSISKHPISVVRAIAKLGENIRIARIQREMTVADLAERMRVAERTLLAIENGKPGVAIGNVAGALLVLQELDQLSSILDMSSRDPTGDMMRKEKLPKRVRKRKTRVRDEGHPYAVDDEGFPKL